MDELHEIELKRLTKQDIVDMLYEFIGDINFAIQTDNAIYAEDLVDLRDNLVKVKTLLDYIS